MSERKWYLGREPIVARPDDGEATLETALTGASAFRLLHSCATRPDIEAVMAKLAGDCEKRVRENLRALLLANELDSAETRKLHFEARLHAGILSLLNAYVSEGAQAEAEINREEEAA